MTVTEQERRAIVYLAKSRRTSLHGATNWDEPGIMAAVTKVAHLDLTDVTCAAMRAASDRELKTPAPIGDPHSSCWRERTEQRRELDVAPVGSRCTVCGEQKPECRRLWTGEHEFAVPIERVDVSPVVAEVKAHIKPMKARPEAKPPVHTARGDEARVLLHPEPNPPHAEEAS